MTNQTQVSAELSEGEWNYRAIAERMQQIQDALGRRPLADVNVLALCVALKKALPPAPAMAAKLSALEAELKRCADHLRSFADLHPEDSTSETAAILWCVEALLTKEQTRG